MAILIRGMQMPKSCMECPLSYRGMRCLIPGNWKDRYNCPEDERSDACPLVEIPKGARLIEAKDVKRHMIPLDFSAQNWISEVDLDIKAKTIFEDKKEQENEVCD